MHAFAFYITIVEFSYQPQISSMSTNYVTTDIMTQKQVRRTVALNSNLEIGKNSQSLSQKQPAKSSAVHKLNLTNMQIKSLLLQVGSTMILTESPSLFESTIPIDALITKIGSVDAPTMHNSE